MSRLLVDENLPGLALGALGALGALKAAGHDVASVAIDAPGLDDRGILAWARREQRVLVSFDTDFGELIFHHGELPPPAVLLLRLDPIEPEAALALALRVLAETVDGGFVVASEQGLRRRPF